MIDDFESCYRAVQAKDPRFDGWFFIGVTSTGIYCRPSCPATTPKRENVRFYPSAAAAQKHGFRACKRCRPDAAPGSPEWDTRADVVARAIRLIADGVVDRAGVPGLAAQLGYSVRQLQRLLVGELGVGPIAIARAQRAQTARVLIETTTLSMAEIALASGFSSVRQFNDTVRAVFALAPTALRRRVDAPDQPRQGTLDLRLPFRRPLCPDNLFGHLSATAVAGVEEVRDGTYRRALGLPHGPGIVELTPRESHIACRASLTDLRDLTTAIARCRRLLDLDADPVAIDGLLASDPVLDPIVRRTPGRRVPRCVDGAEFAIRAVLGQQVSTAAARTVAARLVGERGERVTDPDGGLTHLFPAPERLHDIDLPLPASRKRTLAVLVEALSSGRLALGPGSDRGEAMATLARLPGIGPWTMQMIAMRALADPDAFAATDLGVSRAAETLGLSAKPARLVEQAERWRPWRAYATQYLWSAVEHPINLWPPGAAIRAPRRTDDSDHLSNDGHTAEPDRPASPHRRRRQTRESPNGRPGTVAHDAAA